MLTERFEEALIFSHRLHAQQQRKGRPIPYMAHLLGVTSIVLEYGGDEEQAIAALLHDAVEDQGGEPVLAAIRQRFGERVARLVEGCSEPVSVPKLPWRERKESHLAHLREAAAEVHLIVAADKLHNLRALMADYRAQGELLWSIFKGGRAGTLWYYGAVLQILTEAATTPLTEELERALGNLLTLVDGTGDNDSR